MKGQAWVCLPMILLGVFIAMQNDQFARDLFRFYGAYLILHYIGCWIYLHRYVRR